MGNIGSFSAAMWTLPLGGKNIKQNWEGLPTKALVGARPTPCFAMRKVR
jgi:hypothetical protein